MAQAIGLAALIVVVGVFLPDVLTAVEDFLLVFFDIASEILESIRLQ